MGDFSLQNSEKYHSICFKHNSKSTPSQASQGTHKLILKERIW